MENVRDRCKRTTRIYAMAYTSFKWNRGEVCVCAHALVFVSCTIFAGNCLNLELRYFIYVLYIMYIVHIQELCNCVFFTMFIIVSFTPSSSPILSLEC